MTNATRARLAGDSGADSTESPPESPPESHDPNQAGAGQAGTGQAGTGQAEPREPESTPSGAEAVLPESAVHRSLVRQFEWTLGRMGLECCPGASEASITVAPPSGRPGESGAPVDPLVLAPLLIQLAPADDASVIQWLREARRIQSQNGSGVWEGEPRDDPKAIHAIAGPLLRPYKIRDGQVRLAGCILEDRPTLRIGSVHRSPDGQASIRYRYFGPDGSQIAMEEVEVRGFDRIHAARHRLRPRDRESIENWIGVSESMDARAGQPGCEKFVVDVTVVWSRWASGKIIIQFANGGSASLPFEGWAGDFAAERILPPPFECPHSGQCSYEVIALDDGTITVASAVGRCEETGRELLNQQLALCELSGRRTDRTLMRHCASTGRLVLAEALCRCQWCDSAVVPDVLDQNLCDRCRNRKPLAPADPAIRQFIECHPAAAERLGSRRRWTGWADQNVAVIVGGGLWETRLVVFDVASESITRTASRRRIAGQWKVD